MTPVPLDLWRQHTAGVLPKPDYIRQMHAQYAPLFGLADFLAGTQVDRIEVRAGAVHVVLPDGTRFAIARDDVRQPQLEAVNFRGYEADEWRALARLTPPDGVVFDIGANCGWYAVRLAARFPAARVHAFEPIPHTFARLRENAGLNAVPNLALHPFGLSDRDGPAEFYFAPESSGAASAADLLGLGDGRRVAVTLRTLDGFVRDAGLVPDLIKCDVEGGELLVVRGGRDTIRAARPALFLELLRKWSARFGYHPNEVIDLLAADGYDCYEMAGAELRRLPRMADDTAATNFLFLHRDRHAGLISGWADA